MMNSRKFILRKTAVVALGQLICIGAMVGVFALLGKLDRSVWLGGIVGGLVSLGNFFFMAVCVDLASDRAQAGNVKGGQALIRFSYFGRLALMVLVLFAFVKSGLCNVLSTVLPLVFTRPILTLSEFFRKGEGK
jgi:hypothetical protein